MRSTPTTIAIHFGTFQLSGEDFDQPVRDLAKALAEAPSSPGPFRALREGHTVRVRLRRSWAKHRPDGAEPGLFGGRLKSRAAPM